MRCRVAERCNREFYNTPVTHILVDVSFASVVTFPAFESRKLTERARLANSLATQPSIVFRSDAAPPDATAFDAPSVPKIIVPSATVNETLIQTVIRHRRAALWWEPRAGAESPAIHHPDV